MVNAFDVLRSASMHGLRAWCVAHLTNVRIDYHSGLREDLDHVDVKIVLSQSRVPQPRPDLNGGANLGRKFVDLAPDEQGLTVSIFEL